MQKSYKNFEWITRLKITPNCTKHESVKERKTKEFFPYNELNSGEKTRSLFDTIVD